MAVLIGHEREPALPSALTGEIVEGVEVVLSAPCDQTERELTGEGGAAERIAEHRRDHQHRPAVTGGGRLEVVVFLVVPGFAGIEPELEFVRAPVPRLRGVAGEILDAVDLARSLYHDMVGEAERVRPEGVDLLVPERAFPAPDEDAGRTILAGLGEDGQIGLLVAHGFVSVVQAMDRGSHVEAGDLAAVEDHAEGRAVHGEGIGQIFDRKHGKLLA